MKVPIAATLGLMLAGCVVHRADIENAPLVMTTSFSGSYDSMIECVKARIVGGKIYEDPDGKRVVLYDAVKELEWRGTTHYALIFSRVSESRKSVDFKKLPAGSVDKYILDKFWTPVEACARETA